jgi:hypothetical protein
MLLTFGTTDAGCYPGVADAAGNPGRRGASSTPVVIGPQSAAYVYVWAPGCSQMFSPEIELGGWVR